MHLALYNTLADYEENLLEERFGDEYLEYKKNVRKWIPITYLELTMRKPFLHFELSIVLS